MYYIDTRFGDWLINELNNRHWSQGELARRSGGSTGTISNIMTGRHEASNETITAIAKALRLPVEIVFVGAGLLRGEPTRDRETEFIYLFRKLPDYEQDRLIKSMHITLAMLEQKH